MIHHYVTILRQQPRPIRFLASRILMRTGLSRLIVIDRDGYRIRFHPAALSSVIWINPTERTAEERLLRRCVESGDKVIDVGANIGTVTLALANAVGPEGVVLSVEPHPDIFAFLEDNLALNQVGDWVTALNLALGAQKGRIGFSSLSDDSQNHVVLNDRHTQSIFMQTLDAIAPDGPIRLIKIDVEGYEPEVLAGADQVCKRTEIIYLECIPRLLERFGWTEQHLLEHLKEREFCVYVLDGENLHANVVGNKEKKMLLCLRDPDAFTVRTGIPIKM